MTQRQKSKDINFCYESFVPRPNFLLKYYTIDGKERKLFDSEISVYMAIMTFVGISMNNKQYCDIDGYPFCGASQATIGEKANGASRLTVRKAIATLSEIGLILVVKSEEYSVDKIYLVAQHKDYNGEVMGTQGRGMVSDGPGEAKLRTRGDDKRATRGDGSSASTSNIETNNIDSSNIDSKDKDLMNDTIAPNDRLETQPHESPNGDCQEKPLAQNQPGKPEDVRPNYVESPPSEGRSLNPNPARTLPTSPNATQRQNVDTSGKIKSALNMDLILDRMHTLLKEDMADPESELTQDTIDGTLDFITTLSVSNGYPKPSQSYMENPNVLAMGLAQQGYMGVYTSLYAHYGRECP